MGEIEYATRSKDKNGDSKKGEMSKVVLQAWWKNGRLVGSRRRKEIARQIKKRRKKQVPKRAMRKRGGGGLWNVEKADK
jgi:hypothetical protein